MALNRSVAVSQSCFLPHAESAEFRPMSLSALAMLCATVNKPQSKLYKVQSRMLRSSTRRGTLCSWRNELWRRIATALRQLACEASAQVYRYSTCWGIGRPTEIEHNSPTTSSKVVALVTLQLDLINPEAAAAMAAFWETSVAWHRLGAAIGMKAPQALGRWGPACKRNATNSARA